MIVKLNKNHKKVLIDYLKQNIEANLFIIYLVNKFINKDGVIDIWADIQEHSIRCVLVKYYEIINFYTSEAYDKIGIKKIMNNLDYEQVQGMSCMLKDLEDTINFTYKKEVNLCRLNELNYNLNNYNSNKNLSKKEYKITKMSFINIRQVVNLYKEINEFENTNVYHIKEILDSGRGYIVKTGRKVISMAKSTYEIDECAIIVGVATHNQYRNKGLAKLCITRICDDLIKEKKIPCLMYENNELYRFYKSIGFEKIGDWSIYSR